MFANASTPNLSLSQQLAALWDGVALWVAGHFNQIVIAALIGAVIVAILHGAKLFGLWLCRPEKSRSNWVTIIGNTLSRTRIWFMSSVAAQVIVWLGRAPAEIGVPVRALFIIAAGLQAAVWIRSLILGLVEKRARETAQDDDIQSAVGLIRLLLTVSLFVLASILILANLGVNVTGLLAGLGIGGIAIGLAAQGIFSDLFAALSILFDKPFKIGDWIRWETTQGIVEGIGLKSSRIRAFSGEQIIISNANLLAKEVRNFTKPERRRINQPLGIVFHTPLELCESMAALLEPAVSACAGCVFVRCGLESFGASSLDFTLVYDIDADNQTDILTCRNAVNLAVMRVFSEQGIAFAYPTQTTYTAGPDGALVMPYAQLMGTVSTPVIAQRRKK